MGRGRKIQQLAREPEPADYMRAPDGPAMYRSPIAFSAPLELLQMIAEWFAARECMRAFRVSADRPCTTNAASGISYQGVNLDRLVFMCNIRDNGQMKAYRCDVSPYPFNGKELARLRKKFVGEEPVNSKGKSANPKDPFTPVRPNPFGNPTRLVRPELAALRAGVESRSAIASLPPVLEPDRPKLAAPDFRLRPSPTMSVPSDGSRLEPHMEEAEMIEEVVISAGDDFEQALGEIYNVRPLTADSREEAPMRDEWKGLSPSEQLAAATKELQPSKAATKTMPPVGARPISRTTVRHEDPRALTAAASAAGSAPPADATAVKATAATASDITQAVKQDELGLERTSVLKIMFDLSRDGTFAISDAMMEAIAIHPNFPASLRARARDLRKGIAKCMQRAAHPDLGLLAPVRSETIKVTGGLYKLVGYRFTEAGLALVHGALPPVPTQKAPQQVPPAEAKVVDTGAAASRAEVKPPASALPPPAPVARQPVASVQTPSGVAAELPPAQEEDRLLVKAAGGNLSALSVGGARRIRAYISAIVQRRVHATALRKFTLQCEQLRIGSTAEERRFMDILEELYNKK